MTTSTVWRAATSRPALAGLVIAALIALLLLGGEYRRHRGELAITVAPITAPTAKRAESWERAPLSPSCPEVTVLRPPARQVARLEREFGVDLSQEPRTAAIAENGGGSTSQPEIAAGATPSASGRQILGLKTLPRLRYGGEALVTLPPGGGEVELTIKANQRPFAELLSEWGAGGMAGVDQDGQRWRGYVFVEPARIGRFYLRGEAGVEGMTSGTGAYAMAGVEVRF